MGFRVTTEVFEGPFDLLLHLVTRSKVEITEVPIAEITNGFLAYLETLKEFDLERASEFLLIAAQLLEIKAAALLPGDRVEGEPSAWEVRERLVKHLIDYTTFKGVAAEFASRIEVEGRYFPREAEIELEFATLDRDFIRSVKPESMFKALRRRLGKELPRFSLGHVIARPVPLSHYVEVVLARLASGPHTLRDLVGADAGAPEIVGTFLALLELFRRGEVALKQPKPFAEIKVERVAS